jgi:glycosyltransferase involved in cell wall biosynthesis
MRILQIGTIDKAGGAAQVSWDLKTELEKRGHFVSMFVQDKVSQDPRVFKVPPTFPKQGIISRILANDIDFYNTDYILKTKEFIDADVVHCHNLHGYFFKLDTLRKISKEKPVVWTLHDMWAVSAHCAYPPEDSLKNGFYQCSELRHYAQIEWHNEKYLMFKKRRVYQQTKIHLVTPSEWLKKLVSQSVLKDKPINIINNGIDTEIFKPQDKSKLRQKLGIPENKKVILFLAAGGTDDPRKGWQFAEAVVKKFSQNNNTLFLSVGGSKEDRSGFGLWFIPGTRDRTKIAEIFSLSDIFLFPSLADNFPLTVLESMASGTPVVAFDTGGVKEQIIHKKTGYLTKYKNAEDLSSGLEWFLSLSSQEQETISLNCRQRTENNFTIEKMTDNYLNLYQSLL